MIAEDLVYGTQTDWTLCLEIDGVIYIDREIIGGGEPVGGNEVKDRVMDSFVFTQSVAPFNGTTRESTLGSVRLANTRNAPLTAEMAKSFRGKDYVISVCGYANKGLGNEEYISYDNRIEWLKGKVNGARWSENSFLLSLGSSDAILSQDFLDTIIKDSDEVIDGDFNFTSPNTTSADSTGIIDVNVNVVGSSATITPSVSVTELDIAINPISGSALTSFVFSDVSTLLVQTNNGVSIGMSSNTTTVFTVTLSFPAANSMDWIFRDVDVESISNWSVAPVSISPDFGDNVNSTLKWRNLQGISQITFDVTGIPGTKNILVPPQDPLTRPHIFGSNNSIKMWPLRIETQKPEPTSLVFDTPPASSSIVSGIFGFYDWQSAGLASLEISAVYGVSALVVTSDGNKVFIQNDESGIEIAFSRIRKDSATDPDKVGLRPVGFGNKITNVTPLELRSGKYHIGATGAATFPVTEVRNDLSAIPQAASLIDFLNNQTAEILSWYDDIPADPIIEVSGNVGVITVDISTSEKTLLDAVNFICNRAGITLNSVDPRLANLTVSCWFDKQVTVSQVLSELLTPLDAIFYLDDGLIVEKRKSDEDNADLLLDRDLVRKVEIGIEEVGLHRLVINHSRNWTIQSNPYGSEYASVERLDESIQYLDHPANTIRSGSGEVTLNTCLDTAASASNVLKVFQREKRVKHKASMYLKSIAGRVRPNFKIVVDDPVMPGGYFVSDSVMFNRKTNEQFVSGVWYG